MRIDGKNIIDFSAYILDGSYESLLSYPPLKKVDSTSWAEFDGIEVDLEDVKLDKKEVELNFYLKDRNNFDKFIEYLKDSTYREWYFDDIGQTYKLRFVGFSKIDTDSISIDGKILLSDDFPLRNYEYLEPTDIGVKDHGYSLNRVSFSNYGILPLQHSLGEVLNPNKTKNVLEVSNRLMNGVVVEPLPLKLDGRDITIKCFIHANLSNFFRNYNAFLFDCSKPKEKVLTVHQKDYKCYYKESKITDFSLYGREVWCEFDLKLFCYE